MFKYFFNEFMLKLELKTTQIKIEIRNPQLYTSGIRTPQPYTSYGIRTPQPYTSYGIRTPQLYTSYGIRNHQLCNLMELELESISSIEDLYSVMLPTILTFCPLKLSKSFPAS